MIEKRKEELNKMSVDELRKYASTLKIKKIRSYRKTELIDVVIETELTKSKEVKEYKEDNKKVTKSDNKEVTATDRIERKKKYIENIEIGSLVAFKLSSGKVKSAKVTNKSSKTRKLKLETQYGKEFIISYDDVVWVKTTRWPAGVWRLLKGIEEPKEPKEVKSNE